jgi:hypothetical protein
MGTSRQRHDRTIEQLVDQGKVVLDGLLVQPAKVAAAEGNDLVAEFKDERCRDVGFGDSSEIEVLVPDVEEGGRSEGDDGGADVGVGNDVDAEDVGDRAADVGAKDARDEDFPLQAQYEEGRDGHSLQRHTLLL